MKFLLSFLVAALVAVSLTLAQCPEKYTRFSTSHTFCSSTPYGCTVDRQKSRVSEEDKELILRMHNEYRSRIATGSENLAGGMPPASKMLQMEWDDELAAISQKQTETCHYGHDCGECRMTESFAVGQNIGLHHQSWRGFLTALYDEVADFHKSKMSPFVPGPTGRGKYGHFTQMVWDTTWTVGCGYSEYTAGGRRYTYHSCNYGPSGNIRDGTMYETGSPASACPSNSEPSREYNGLCKVKDINQSPEGSVAPPGYSFYCNFQGQDDCQYAVTSGERGWSLFRNRGGNYHRIALNGGQSTTIEFQKSLSSANGMICTEIVLRRQPAMATDYLAGIFQAGLGRMSMSYQNFAERSAWYQFIPHGGQWGARRNADYKLSLTFTVRDWESKQLIEIKKITAKDC